jgi:uncharacterized protein YcbX
VPDRGPEHKHGDTHGQYGAQVLTVREIWRFPVKSIGGERLQTAPVGEQGVVGDRAWGVRDQLTGMVLTGRREPRLLMLTARLDGDQPVIETEDGQQLTTGAELSGWLDRPVELVAASSGPAVFEGVRDPGTEQEWETWEGPTGSFHDGRSTVTLGSTTSLAGYDDWRRFRLNLILDHAGDATEDDLVEADLTIGDVGLFVRKPVERCVMVTRAQPGLPRDLSVLKRVIAERDNRMGVGAVVTRHGTISVGDVVNAATGS